MAGYNRPEGGWNYVFNGINTLEAPDALQPDFYPYARNIRGLADRSVQTRPGYTLFSTSPTITTSCPLAPGVEDTAYTASFSAVGGISPYTWSVITGALPSGLTLSSSGDISGTPTLAGAFTFTVLATDSAGGTDSVSCSIYICPAGSGADWIGCLGGSFSVPADWFMVGNVVVSGNQANIDGTGSVAGFARNVSGGCGSSTDQEVYMVYNTKSNPTSGNRGYFRIGPGCRMNGSLTSNYSGYFFTAQIWGGTSGTTCGFGTGTIALNLLRIEASVVTSLAVISIAGPDLTPGIPFDIQVTVEGSGARVTGFLGGTQLMTALDPTPLSAGQMGLVLVDACGGINPNVKYSFIKGRNL